MGSKLLAFGCASVALIAMNFTFDGGFKIERVLISFLMYLVLKSVFVIVMDKVGSKS